MSQEMRRVQEWTGVDKKTFDDEIVPRGQPAVLRGLVGGWPAVRHATSSPEAICEYLGGLDTGVENNAVLVPPEFRGRMFYGPDLGSFNFLRKRLSVSAVLAQMARYSHFEQPPSVALQCAQVADSLPAFVDAHAMPLLEPTVLPRIWLGNAFITPAHIDELDNLACVVSGRRRFTLFPPEQVSNLYVGPLEFTPAGAPVSLVSLESPDFERFPRFRDALAAAQVAELEPGDALFIPAVWWHHVQSFDAVNILVNYWWLQGEREGAGPRLSPTKAMLHALLAIKGLPAAHRQAWAQLFAHYAFAQHGDPGEHLPAAARGVLGELAPEQVDAILQTLVAQRTA